MNCYDMAILLPWGIVPAVVHSSKYLSGTALAAFNSAAFTTLERRAAISLSFVYITRMMGLFLLLPVLSVLARDLQGATPLLIGLAIGIYALFQALLQIPFGLLSDRFGRKPVILAGLAIFIIGSIIAAMTDSIWGIIAGRALQGGGAISAVIMALAADLTRDTQRTKIMAVIGVSIGLSFMISIILGPLLMLRFQLAGIFYFIAFSGLVAALLVWFVVPVPAKTNNDRNIAVVISEMPVLLRNRELLRIDFGIFLLHLLITASFVCIPLILLDNGIAVGSHWSVYMYGALGSLLILLPMVGFAERKFPVKWVMMVSILGFALALFAVGAVAQSYRMAIVCMVLFFGFLSVLESLLPSLASRTAPSSFRGTVMGVYSTSQFLGAFVGGVAGGWLTGKVGSSNALFVLCAVCLCWLPIAWYMRDPERLSNFRLALRNSLLGPGTNITELSRRLQSVAGVVEVTVVDRAAYLKINRREFDEQSLEEFQSSGESVR